MPVAVVGAFLGLFGRGLALDVYGQIGLVNLFRALGGGWQAEAPAPGGGPPR